MEKNVEDKRLTLIKVMLIVSIAILLTSFVLLFLSQKNLKESKNKDASVYENLAGLFGIKTKKYTIKFNTNGAGTLADQKVKFLKKVKKPAELIKKGYKFVAWKLSNNKTFNFKTRVTKNLSLNATWRPYKYECKNTKVAGVQSCVERYLVPRGRTMQNFAITEDYVYFTAPLYGPWTNKKSELICLKEDEEKGKCKSDESVSNSHIIRVSKSDFNNYSITALKYSGHGQSFDVITEDGKDVIFFNNAASPSYNESYGWGAQSNGIAVFTLDKKQYDTKSGAGKIIKTIIPGKTMFIDVTKKKIGYWPVSIDKMPSEKKYYDLLIHFGEMADQEMDGKNYLAGQVAVKGDYLAYAGGGRIRVFDLDQMRNNKQYELLTEYKREGSIQGIALSGNGKEVLQIYQDNNGYAVIQRYNSNGKNVKGTNIKMAQATAKINLDAHYGKGNYETEGIKVYKEGNTKYVYIGISRKNTSPRESDILRIKYNDLQWKNQ